MDKLKNFLLEKGENIDNLSDIQILQRVKQVRKGQELIKLENEICNYCNNKFDDCICSKCSKCYEIICECVDDIKIITKKEQEEDRVREEEDRVREEENKIKEKLLKKEIKRQFKEKQKLIEKENKEKVKKEKQKQKLIEKQKKKDEKDENLLLISLYSHKIKLKIFLLEKIIPHPKIYPDIIELLILILLKNNIKLKNEEKENINGIFNRIYQEPVKNQKIILKCIIDNLIK
jgi:hypothetical protein